MSVQRNMTKSRSPAVAVGGGRPRGRCGPASATGGVSAGQDGLRWSRRHARDPDTRGGLPFSGRKIARPLPMPAFGAEIKSRCLHFLSRYARQAVSVPNPASCSLRRIREAERSRVLVLGFLTPPVGVEALHNAQYGRGVWRNMLDDRNTNNLAGDHQSLFGLIAIARDALEDRT